MGCVLCKFPRNVTRGNSSRTAEGLEGTQSGHGAVKLDDGESSASEADRNTGEHGQDEGDRDVEGQQEDINQSNQAERERQQDRQQDIEDDNPPDERNDFGDASHPDEDTLFEPRPLPLPSELGDSGKARQPDGATPSHLQSLPSQMDGPSQEANAVLRDPRVLNHVFSESIAWNGEIEITRDIVMTSGIEADSDAWRMMQEQLGVAGWA